MEERKAVSAFSAMLKGRTPPLSNVARGKKKRWEDRKFVGVHGKSSFVSTIVQDQRRIENGVAGKRTVRRVLCAEAGVPDSARQMKRLERKDRRRDT